MSCRQRSDFHFEASPKKLVEVLHDVCNHEVVSFSGTATVTVYVFTSSTTSWGSFLPPRLRLHPLRRHWRQRHGATRWWVWSSFTVHICSWARYVPLASPTCQWPFGCWLAKATVEVSSLRQRQQKARWQITPTPRTTTKMTKATAHPINRILFLKSCRGTSCVTRSGRAFKRPPS